MSGRIAPFSSTPLGSLEIILRSALCLVLFPHYLLFPIAGAMSVSLAAFVPSFSSLVRQREREEFRSAMTLVRGLMFPPFASLQDFSAHLSLFPPRSFLVSSAPPLPGTFAPSTVSLFPPSTPFSPIQAALPVPLFSFLVSPENLDTSPNRVDLCHFSWTDFPGFPPLGLRTGSEFLCFFLNLMHLLLLRREFNP